MNQPLSACVVILSLIVVCLGYSLPFPSENPYPLNLRSKRAADTENPEEVVRMLLRLAQEIADSDSFVHEKRGIDLGLSRGFSGSQAAKHLMGLAAANFANGPGRRRRDVENSLA